MALIKLTYDKTANLNVLPYEIIENISISTDKLTLEFIGA
jgi:hypothetical protein